MTPSLARHVFRCLLVFLSGVSAFSAPSVAVIDSAGVSEDSSQRKFVVPIPLVGSVDRLLAPRSVMTDSERNVADYRSLPDLLAQTAGTVTREFGPLGQYPDVTLRGIGGAAISYLSDGVRLNDPLFGLFNPVFVPLEQVERIEPVSGTQAYLHGLNATGAAFNLVSRSAKAPRARSRLRYSESAFGYSLVDGMVSQDIVRGLNVTAGAQHAAFGPRFSNDGQDVWNGRVKVRYNINSTVNIFAAETYNQAQLGLNGGIDIAATPDSLRFDRLQAVVRNSDAYEKSTRNDLRLGVALRLLCDTADISTVTAWLSSQVREFRDEENRPFPNGIYLSQDQRSQWSGLTLQHHQGFGSAILDAAFEFQSQRVLVTPATEEDRASLLAFHGSLALRPLAAVSIIPSARYDLYLDQPRLAYGVRGLLAIGGGVELSGGYSRSFRFPTFEERFGLDTLLSSGLTDESIERHHLVEGGITWNPESTLTVGIVAFHRTIFGPIAALRDPGGVRPYRFLQGGKELLQGFDGSFSARAGVLFVEGRVSYLDQPGGEDAMTVPRWAGSGGLYYWGTLFEGHLNLRAGFRGTYVGGFAGREFNQQALRYLNGGLSSDLPAATTLDLVLLARLGDAHLHFIWDNFLDRQYVTAAFYPMTQRAMRFGVSWEFLN